MKEHKVRILLRNTESGQEEILDLVWNGDWAGEDGPESSFRFQWLENNFCCDCNRHLEWIRKTTGREPDEDDWDDAECGHEKYRVLWLEFDGVRSGGDAEWE
jgi:hypothetical protein